MNWRALWPYARTWWGSIVAAVTILAAVYRGPKFMFETYEWYMEKLFDQKVMEFLDKQVSPEVLTQHGPRIWAIPKSISEISAETRLPERRVAGCLRRLKKKKSVQEEGDNWKATLGK